MREAPSSSPAAPSRLGVWLFTLICGVYILLCPGKPWIEASYELSISRRLVRHLELSYPEPDVAPESMYARVRAPNGRWYDYHSIGNVIAMLPAAAVGVLAEPRLGLQRSVTLNAFVSSFTGAALAAAGCVVFAKLLMLLGRPAWLAVKAALALAFLTLVFPYAVTNYEGNLLALAILSGVYFVARFERSARLRELLLAGLCAGAAVNTREFGLLFAGVAGVYVLWRFRTARVVAWYVAGLLPFLAFWCWFNWQRTGNPLTTPIFDALLHERFQEVAPKGSIFEGLGVLLFSPGGSIFVYSPVLLLALFGVRAFWRADRRLALLTGSIAAVWLLATAKLPEQMGFICWGPRFTLEITPLLLLPLAWSPLLAEKRWRAALWLVCAWSALVQLAGVLTSWFARMSAVLARGRETVLWSVSGSQWWDSLTVLAINAWNATLGRWWPAAPPAFHASLSEASAYTARTFEPWWNRVVFEEPRSWPVIAIIILFLLATITLAAVRLRRASTATPA